MNGRLVVSNVLMLAMVVLGSTFLTSSRRGLGVSSGFGSDLRDDGLAALRVVMALRSMLSPEPKLSLTFSAGGSGSFASPSSGSAVGSFSSSSASSPSLLSFDCFLLYFQGFIVDLCWCTFDF